MSETVDISVTDRQDNFVDVRIIREWKCRRAGHDKHRWDHTLHVRKGEIAELAEKILRLKK
jgi:hypothetical protein